MHRAALASLALLLLSSRAQATPIETFAVPTDGSSATSIMILLSGQDYVIEVAGTFVINTVSSVGNGDQFGDAEYADFSNPPTSVTNTAVNGTDIGVKLNGSKVSWGPFANDHVYSVVIGGNGTVLSASYQDTFFPDNSGSLSLSISRVPEPGTAILFGAGLAALGARRPRATRCPRGAV